MNNLVEIKHPLILHKLKMIRDKNTDVKLFRELVDEISALMAYEVTRDIEVRECRVETPLKETVGYYIPSDLIAVVPILRAGLGMVNGILKFLPMAKVGHIGIYRDHDTLQPVDYYCKLPSNLESKVIIIVDPMLATGGSASFAVKLVKEHGGKNIKFVCLISAPEGIEYLLKNHPDVVVYTAAVDEKLNEFGYIIPGLGDAGDRFFGTK